MCLFVCVVCVFGFVRLLNWPSALLFVLCRVVLCVRSFGRSVVGLFVVFVRWFAGCLLACLFACAFGV